MRGFQPRGSELGSLGHDLARRVRLGCRIRSGPDHVRVDLDDLLGRDERWNQAEPVLDGQGHREQEQHPCDGAGDETLAPRRTRVDSSGRRLQCLDLCHDAIEIDTMGHEIRLQQRAAYVPRRPITLGLIGFGAADLEGLFAGRDPRVRTAARACSSRICLFRPRNSPN